MFNPSLIGDNGIKFNKVLYGDSCPDLPAYSLFNNGLAWDMEWRVFVVGVNEDVGVKQAYGQGILHRARLYQLRPSLYDRDGRSGLSHDAASSLPLPAALLFSGIQQNQLLHRASQVEALLRCLVSSVVRYAAAYLFSLFVLNLSKERGFSQGYCGILWVRIKRVFDNLIMRFASSLLEGVMGR